MATRAPARILRVARDGCSQPDSSQDAVRRAQLAELQRLRIVSAMLDVACEHGAANVSVTQVVERAGVSRRTFYELFVDRDECFQAALDHALDHAAERVVPAFRAQSGWRERIRAGLIAALALFDEQPRLGQVLVCESLSGGPHVLARREQAIEEITRVIEAGTAEAEQPALSLPVLGEGVLGGVLMVLQRRLAEPEGGPLIDLANPLMAMIVLPYLGAAAARREQGLPVIAPTVAELSTPLIRDPFKESGMRMTYRTVRVLLAIGEHVDASNRTIGRTAGVVDQGQISKLLSRLQRAGLIENLYGQPGRGAPNSWALTEKGRRLTDGIRAHAEGAGMELQQRGRER